MWLHVVCVQYGSDVINSFIFYNTLGMFYFTLKNIEPAKRSALHSMWLLAAVKTSHIKQYGINIILQPIVEEIKQLESVSYALYLCKFLSFF